jgi:hypothetical protein
MTVLYSERQSRTRKRVPAMHTVKVAGPSTCNKVVAKLNELKRHLHLILLFLKQGLHRAINKALECSPNATTPPFRFSYKSPWGPIGLWDVEDPTFSRRSADRWWRIGQLYAPTALYSPERFLVFISVRVWVNPKVIVRLEGLGKLKKVQSLGFKHVTFYFSNNWKLVLTKFCRNKI